MMVDVVLEMDDIDMMLALTEMARDKLTTRRIARSEAGAKANRAVQWLCERVTPLFARLSKAPCTL
jgi:hypothetical protein